MTRSIVLLLAGALIGSAAAFWLAGERSSSPMALDDGAADRSLSSDETALGSTPTRFEAALTLLGTDAADLTDAVTLDREIRRIAGTEITGSEPSARGEAALGALLLRLAEVEPLRAIEIAQELGLGRRFLLPALQRFAEVDTEGALAALRELEHPGMRAALALELFVVMGDTEANIERIASMLPEGNRIAFELAAVMRRVRIDPVLATTRAVAIEDPTVRGAALDRIAFLWGSRDGRAAMAQLETIPEGFERLAYFDMVLRWWSRDDPSAALEYVRNAPDEYLAMSLGGLRTLASRAPAEVLAVVDRLPSSPQQTMLRTFAMNALAEQDPAAALASAVALPEGPERDGYLSRAAGQLARRDPAAAVAWARAQADPRFMASVVGAVLEVDSELAVDLAVEFRDDPAVLQSAASVARRYPEVFPRLVERLLDAGQSRSSGFSDVLGAWADTRPAVAFDWVLDHESLLDAGLARRLAGGLAVSDIDAATEAMGRIPNRYRADWLKGAAGGYAQRDAASAMQWLEAYRGQLGYEAAAAAVIVQIGRRDRERAQRLIQENLVDPALKAQVEAQLDAAPPPPGVIFAPAR